jgi:hypothetical protein
MKSFSTLRRWSALAMLPLLLAGCLEMTVRVSIREDGSALIEMAYAVYKRFLLGEFIEIERNELVPLSREDADAFVDRLPGAKLVEYSERDLEDQQFASIGGLRVYRFAFSIPDIEDVRFDHIRFAWYPWGDERIFQFRVEKDLSVITKEETTADPLADAAFGDRKFRLNVEFPARLRGSNAQTASWGKAEWEIPMRNLYSSLDSSVVAWARTSATGAGWTGQLMPFWYRFQSEDWRDPDSLPTDVGWEKPDMSVDDPRERLRALPTP